MRNIDPRSKDKARKPQGIETMAINRKALFQKAHEITRMKRFNNPALNYRETFAAALSLAYADARQQAEWRAMAAQRETMRDAQNWGAPVRSFRGEKTFFGGSRYASAAGA